MRIVIDTPAFDLLSRVFEAQVHVQARIAQPTVGWL
jgi:hypothetical protein